jgi:DNA-binding MarR family transcriptional regulator
VATRSPSKRALAADAWQPLARFFFDTIRHRQRVLGDEGLTPNDIRALTVLDPTHGKTMRDLADEWFCDASNATFIVDRLEERGLAERRTVPTDRRVKLVVLTPEGARTRDRVFGRMFEPPPELLRLSHAELEAIRDAAAKLPVSSTGTGRAEPSRAEPKRAASG